ncbi:MAG TPA: hypothetical protein VKP11_07935 [Frankiaceae bacterium]|nr:hypothetical protein [Frankiaceae bacterium]
MAPVVSPAAYLRVYEPLAAFPPAERARWERLAAEGAPSRSSGVRRERAAALVAAVRPTLEVAEEGAFVQRVDGLPYVCPWRTQLRVWKAALEFRELMQPRIAEAFLPRRVTEAAEVELSRWEARRPDLKTYVQTSTWVVPLPWFVAFDPGERLLVVGNTPDRSLTYTTLMGNARRRIARALQVLRRTLPEAPTVEGLTELGAWLEEFHPHSRVELDYGGLVELLDDVALRADTSVADLTAAFAALAEGRGQDAVDAYERVMSRWRLLQGRENAS